jgi:hypothetical protein
VSVFVFLVKIMLHYNINMTVRPGRVVLRTLPDSGLVRWTFADKTQGRLRRPGLCKYKKLKEIKDIATDLRIPLRFRSKLPKRKADLCTAIARKVGSKRTIRYQLKKYNRAKKKPVLRTSPDGLLRWANANTPRRRAGLCKYKKLQDIKNVATASKIALRFRSRLPKRKADLCAAITRKVSKQKAVPKKISLEKMLAGINNNLNKPNGRKRTVAAKNSVPKPNGRKRTVAAKNSVPKPNGRKRTVAAKNSVPKPNGRKITVAAKNSVPKPNGRKITVAANNSVPKPNGRKRTVAAKNSVPKPNGRKITVAANNSVPKPNGRQENRRPKGSYEGGSP